MSLHYSFNELFKFYNWNWLRTCNCTMLAQRFGELISHKQAAHNDRLILLLLLFFTVKALIQHFILFESNPSQLGSSLEGSAIFGDKISSSRHVTQFFVTGKHSGLVCCVCDSLSWCQWRPGEGRGLLNPAQQIVAFTPFSHLQHDCDRIFLNV